MSAAAEAAVIAAMLGGARTSAEIRTASSLSAAEVKAGIQRARFKGKILFDRLALAPSQRAEAEAVDADQAGRTAMAEAMMDSDPAAAASAPLGHAGVAAEEAVREEDGGADVSTAPPSDSTPVAVSAAALVAEIEVWLAASGTSASAFGLAVCRDLGMVRRLREGKRPTPAKVQKARAFMAAHPEGIPGRPAKAATATPARSETRRAKLAIDAGPPSAPAPTIEEEVRREASMAGARRRVAQSTGTVKTVLPVAEPEVRRSADPARSAFAAPMRPPVQPRRRIALPSDLSPVETIQTMLAEEPRDLIRAVARTHEALWRRCIVLGRVRGETPAAALYAALARGIDAIEAEQSTEEKADA